MSANVYHALEKKRLLASQLCILKTDSKSKRVEKAQQDGPVVFTYCFRICDVVSQLMMVHGKYLLLKKAEQLKHSSSMKSVAANQIITKYKKQCQMEQSIQEWTK